MGLAFRRTRNAGATFARLYISWRGIAPPGTSRPAGFDASNPADPLYDWSTLDRQVRAATAAHLEPILSVHQAPDWAEGPGEAPAFSNLVGTVRPSPTEYGRFMTAAARRYSGSFEGLPRVRHWQAWNEPNLFATLNPQYSTPLSQPVRSSSRPVSPDLYAPLVTALGNAVHAVHSDNVVIAGGTAPFARFGAGQHGVAPMIFMRRLLCMDARNRPVPTCHRRLPFDVWAHDPYTAGGPTHRAEYVENASIGDLPRMRRLLEAAARAHRIASHGPVRFWATEFSWDTKPPEPNGLPLGLHARWTSEALYRMWLSGVSMVAWFQIRDDEVVAGRPGYDIFTSGLYFRCRSGMACDRPKPTLAAFRFPFVAFPAGRRRVRIWARTPSGSVGQVVVQQRSGGHWRRLRSLRSDRFGIVYTTIATAGRGELRAATAGALSRPFSLVQVPDRPVQIFG
jgi:hypothetical protein